MLEKPKVLSEEEYEEMLKEWKEEEEEKPRNPPPSQNFMGAGLYMRVEEM